MGFSERIDTILNRTELKNRIFFLVLLSLRLDVPSQY